MSSFIRSVYEDVLKRDKLFKLYIENIISFFNGKVTLILFGSRARGDNMLSSDYDLAVVVEKCNDVLELTEKLLKMKPHGLPVDIAVFSVDELRDPLVTKMLTPCRILYNGLGLQNTPCV